MKKSELPTSPHLQIYKPQITSILSIAHRISGFCLNFLIIYPADKTSLDIKKFN